MLPDAMARCRFAGALITKLAPSVALKGTPRNQLRVNPKRVSVSRIPRDDKQRFQGKKERRARIGRESHRQSLIRDRACPQMAEAHESLPLLVPESIGQRFEAR
jgi:hypothetical protein